MFRSDNHEPMEDVHDDVVMHSAEEKNFDQSMSEMTEDEMTDSEMREDELTDEEWVEDQTLSTQPSVLFAEKFAPTKTKQNFFQPVIGNNNTVVNMCCHHPKKS